MSERLPFFPPLPISPSRSISIFPSLSLSFSLFLSPRGPLRRVVVRILHLARRTATEPLLPACRHLRIACSFIRSAGDGPRKLTGKNEKLLTGIPARSREILARGTDTRLVHETLDLQITFHRLSASLSFSLYLCFSLRSYSTFFEIETNHACRALRACIRRERGGRTNVESRRERVDGT